MADKNGHTGHKLSGDISDRIRDGEIDPETLTSKRLPTDNSPSAAAIKAGKGTSLGDITRSDPSAQTHED